MIKAALVAFTLLAISATAASAGYIAPVELPSSTPYYDEGVVLDRLQQRGVNAVAVENWGMLIRAYVRQDDGTEAQLFFKRDSLVPVTL